MCDGSTSHFGAATGDRTLQPGVRIAGPISLESERRALIAVKSALEQQALPQALQERDTLRERLAAGVQPAFLPTVGAYSNLVLTTRHRIIMMIMCHGTPTTECNRASKLFGCLQWSP